MESYKILLPENIYKKYLSVIDDIKFTPREIDIISCIIHGKGVKGISRFLTTDSKIIGERSIETHILNIRRKIGGNSKESIVEFIEKSDKYKKIHNYYSSLLIYKEFIKTLAQISILSQSSNFVITIVSWEKNESHDDFLNILDAYLKLSGIKTFIEYRENFNKLSFVPSKVQSFSRTIYLIPERYISTGEEGMAYREELNILTKNTDASVLFLFEKKAYIDNSTSSTNRNILYIDAQQSFYLLFCNILQKVLPDINFIDEIIAGFVNQHRNIITFPSDDNVEDVFYEQNIVENSNANNNKINKYYYFIILLIFISISNFTYNKYYLSGNFFNPQALTN